LARARILKLAPSDFGKEKKEKRKRRKTEVKREKRKRREERKEKKKERKKEKKKTFPRSITHSLTLLPYLFFSALDFPQKKSCHPLKLLLSGKCLKDVLSFLLFAASRYV
jgi:cation transport ATPase